MINNKSDNKKKLKQEKKNYKKVQKELKKITSDKEEIIEIRKKRYIFEISIIIIIILFLLLLLFNKTFFRENYKSDVVDINIPLLMFFVKDENNEIIFKTLRKSEFLNNYFDAYLSNLSRYDCGDSIFYYDDSKKIAIHDIDIKKNIAIKTVKIKYSMGNPDLLCSN